MLRRVYFSLPTSLFVSIQLAIYLLKPPSFVRKDSKPEMADVRGDIRAWILGKSLCKAVCSALCLQHLLIKTTTEFDAIKIIHFEQKAVLCILK